MAITTFKQYQELASRTANFEQEHEEVNYAMGLAGESGELIDGFKKFIFHAHPINKSYIKKEAGDVLWYVSQLMRAFKLQLFDFPKSIRFNVGDRDRNKIMMAACMEMSECVGKVSRIVYDFRFKQHNLSVFFEKDLRVNLSIIVFQLNTLISYAGLTIEEVAEANIEKLKARYPEGFDPEKSINRKE